MESKGPMESCVHKKDISYEIKQEKKSLFIFNFMVHGGGISLIARSSRQITILRNDKHKMRTLNQIKD